MLCWKPTVCCGPSQSITTTCRYTLCTYKPSRYPWSSCRQWCCHSMTPPSESTCLPTAEGQKHSVQWWGCAVAGTKHALWFSANSMAALNLWWLCPKKKGIICRMITSSATMPSLSFKMGQAGRIHMRVIIAGARSCNMNCKFRYAIAA